jgi:hypothetical protein
MTPVAIPEIGTSVRIGTFSRETTEKFRRMKGDMAIFMI